MPGAIFVSYRRATTSNAAGRLADRLMDRFGEEQVFVDVDAIEPGVDFVTVIEQAVVACRVLLVVIGPTWHTVSDPGGRRRLDDPHDPVVVEVRAGLANPGVRVIPVLVEGAQMPRAVDLPPDLARLARLNAARLEHASFRRDVAGLVVVLERMLREPQPAPPQETEPFVHELLPPTTSPDLAEARRLNDGPPVFGGKAHEQIRAAYQRAIDSGHPDAPMARAELNMAFSHLGVHNAAAEDAFLRAITSGHDGAEAVGHYGLAVLAYDRRDVDELEAEVHWLISSRYRAMAVGATRVLFGLYSSDRDHRRAQRAYSRAVELGAEDPPSAWVLEVVDSLDAQGEQDNATMLLLWADAQETITEPTRSAVSERLARRGLPT